MKESLLVKIANEVAYHYILDLSRKGEIKGIEKYHFDKSEGIGYLYYDLNEEIYFEANLWEELVLIGCNSEDITQCLVLQLTV